jgi:hypothetical protein
MQQNGGFSTDFVTVASQNGVHKNKKNVSSNGLVSQQIYGKDKNDKK